VWQCVLPEVTVEGFKKWCISSAMDGTDDDTLCDDSEEGWNVRSGGHCECSVSITFHVN
jgi:hypothetical protein